MIYALSDPLDRWFGEDKWGQHFPWAAWAWTIDALHFGARVAWWDLPLLILLIELVEVYRFIDWERRGRPSPWPVMTDKISVKDVLWGLAGAGVAHLLTWGMV